MIWIQEIISQNISALAGLIGVFVGAWLTNRQTSSQRKLNYYEKQLRELYSPLLGMRKEIQILSEFRLEGEKASQEWWEKVCTVKIGKDSLEATKYYEEKGKMIESQIEYENKQLIEKIIPAYRQMILTFKGNYWLAENETKTFLSTLVKFVETWERFLSKTHPQDVINKISVSESELLPFYKHLEQVHNLLVENLKAGKIRNL